MARLFEGICPLLTETVLNKCKFAGIKTVTDFISFDPEELAKKIKMPYKDVLSIYYALIMKYAGFPQNATSLQCELLESVSILDTGSKRLNKFLCGGIYTGEVTEIHGMPGSGKTQFCFSVISNLILETKSTALYLDASNNFVAKRMEEILSEKSGTDQDAIDNLHNVKVKNVYDIYDLFHYLDILKEELYKQETIFFRYLKVLIIDAITPLLSPCFDGKYLDGLGLMNNLSQLLHTLCSEHKISILVCNNTVQGNNFSIKPALGLNWKYVPSISLCIERLDGTPVHKIKAVKSCRSNLFEEITFNISRSGIID
ncbi:DNA repair protein RAD51 homolog 4-like [Argiope bruennichi]|uniref:DNA repair protein RAD51 like protein n=1 Tax=Argiope bruennichi TaxID=94029 RepID=A0A8T0F9V9_ARGBR|nr:DNA repair protein RAD51 homolog 4-like [Argiope bruennichi]XP_055941546.1 DNA repair protein RAD51 homolog 4-like [Argiope bruennichi]KAF8787182.1 DNA repair protein RAD51 like protein [Argiope bruennichi]